MSDLVERLQEYASDDHERLCEGRCYSCSCGYDDKRDPLLEEAADRIAQLEAALRPLACTCEVKQTAYCSRSEVDCPFWNARLALEERTYER